MLVHKLAVGAAFATAIAVTALFTSFAASSAAIGTGTGAVAIAHYVPNYMLRWDNVLLAPAPLTPVPSR